MKIKVSDLMPNPFRNIENYPIKREKVEALKTSINETSFWDNILARKSKGAKFEIAYGHHRLIALRELEIEQVDIPIRDIDDSIMLKMMADENLDVWQHTTAVINETVLAAKRFLDAELAKCDSWEALNESIKCLFTDDFDFTIFTIFITCACKSSIFKYCSTTEMINL